jgi:hypothetical protein
LTCKVSPELWVSRCCENLVGTAGMARDSLSHGASRTEPHTLESVRASLTGAAEPEASLATPPEAGVGTAEEEAELEQEQLALEVRNSHAHVQKVEAVPMSAGPNASTWSTRVIGFPAAGGDQRRVATPPAAGGWTRPPCRPFKNQSCFSSAASTLSVSLAARAQCSSRRCLGVVYNS